MELCMNSAPDWRGPVGVLQKPPMTASCCWYATIPHPHFGNGPPAGLARLMPFHSSDWGSKQFSYPMWLSWRNLAEGSHSTCSIQQLCDYLCTGRKWTWQDGTVIRRLCPTPCKSQRTCSSRVWVWWEMPSFQVIIYMCTHSCSSRNEWGPCKVCCFFSEMPRLAIIDTGASTSELGSPGQTSVVPPNQWSLRSTETFPDDLGAQQRDSVPGSTIVYGYIYGEFIQCGSRVPYRMSHYFPHTFNVSYSEVRYSLLLYYVLLVPATSTYSYICTTKSVGPQIQTVVCVWSFSWVSGVL